jgi:hypothetical protein
MADNEQINQFEELLAGEPPELGPGPRAGVWTVKAIDAKLDELFARDGLHGRSEELIRGLALLWHDHHEPAHAIAQAIENADDSLLHAILHRREPDYGNATYWFRRVGKHPCFPAIAKRVTELLEQQKTNGLLKQLIQGGEWDAFAFIKECETANQLPPSDPRVLILRQVQAIESGALLAHLLET